MTDQAAPWARAAGHHNGEIARIYKVCGACFKPLSGADIPIIGDRVWLPGIGPGSVLCFPAFEFGLGFGVPGEPFLRRE